MYVNWLAVICIKAKRWHAVPLVMHSVLVNATKAERTLTVAAVGQLSCLSSVRKLRMELAADLYSVVKEIVRLTITGCN